MRRLKYVAAAFLVLGAVLFLVVVGRAARLPSRQIAITSQGATFVPLPGAVNRLADALRFPTVTRADSSGQHDEVFAALETYLANAFPDTHRVLQRETVGHDSLLYTWSGTDATLKPVVLMGHLDVVPIEPGTEAEWRHPPFGGAIADGFVWGRGAIDDKGAVLAMLEATESLVRSGLDPRRTVLIAVGTDEESGGQKGAALIAEKVRSRYGGVDFVVDEGGAVVPPGTIPGIAAPVALVGIAEKGFVSVELTVDGPGGHSSTPPRHTTVGDLARAIARLEARPLPASLRGATEQLFDHLAPEMPLRLRALFANRWLFAPLLTRVLSRSPATDATIRTTTAATMLQGSPKETVLATHARAIVNFRIMPGDSVETVLDHVRRTVADPNVHIRIAGAATAPSPVSSTTSQHWHNVEEAMRQTLPDALVAPYLTLGATDARHFASFTADVYRLLPMRLPPEGIRAVHGTNERVSTTAYLEAIRFYATLIQRAASS